MNINNIIHILLFGLLIAVVFAGLAYFMLLELRKKKGLKVELKAGNDFLYNAFKISVKFAPLKKYMGKIRRRIEMIDLSDEWTICRKTMRFTLISLGSTILILLFLLFFSRNTYFTVISVMTVYMLHNQIIRMLVDRIDNKLLRQFEVFLGNVRHHYHEHGMIDEAIYDSIGECGYEVSLHANRMYEVLTASNVDECVEQYNETVPNKYMKTFVAMCYLVQRFGDKLAEGKSVYLNNLNYLKQEINLELLRREKLGYLFQSLSAIAVFPVFTLKPLENWAITNIPELKEYYEGAYGFLSVIILFILVFGSYQLITRLQSNTEYAPAENTINTFLLKISFIRNFIEGLIEKNHKKALKYDRLLKRTGAKTSVNQFYVKQVLFAILAFLFVTGIFINIHIIVRNNLLYSSPGLSLAEYDRNIDAPAEMRIIESDRKYILHFSGKHITFRELDEALRNNGEYTDSKQSGIAAKRILDKLMVYNSHNYKWWELLTAFFVSAVSFYLPWWMLLFRERILKMNMEDEVMQFHTIILMLMHIERIHVEDILNWMEQFADIFKSSISRCINNYENGDRQALEQLAQDEPYTPFARIVENLQSAADKITIEHAFDELKTEREYYQEKRKQDNEILVNKKGMWGKFIAFIPMGAAVFLYLLIPFILVSAAQLSGFYEEINKAF